MGGTLSYCCQSIIQEKSEVKKLGRMQKQLIKHLKVGLLHQTFQFKEQFKLFHREKITSILKNYDVNLDQVCSEVIDLKLPPNFPNDADVFFEIQNHILGSQKSIMKDIWNAYNLFLQDLFGLSMLNEENEEKLDVSISTNSQISIFDQLKNQFVYNNVKYINRDNEKTQSIDHDVKNKTYEIGCKNNSQNNFQDYQNIHYHRSYHQHEINKKKSVLLEKPKALSHYINLKLQSDDELATILLNQADGLFKAFRLLIKYYYGDLMQLYFSESEEVEEQDREMFIQRIIQGILLSRDGALAYILQSVLEFHYIQVDKKPNFNSIKGNRGGSQTIMDGLNEPTLNCTLFPQSQVDKGGCIRLSDVQDANDSSVRDEVDQRQIFQKIIREEEEYEGIHTTETLNPIMRGSLRRDQFMQLMRNSEIMTQEAKIPYQETFNTIHRIVTADKPWRKFKLIVKLDLMIIQIFLRSRSESQFVNFYDTISAEDSKQDIILFILYKFQKKYAINLYKDLFLQLRFMLDFDGVLHNDIKNIFCPVFVRFYGILELLIKQI